jgi:hypothetical protein
VLLVVAARDPVGDPGATTLHLTLTASAATARRARTSR